MIRRSYTAVVEQNTLWTEEFATEPYEAAWANQAVVFVRAIEAADVPEGSFAAVEISPDGLHWCAEGTTLGLPQRVGEVTFCRVAAFGGFLRLRGRLANGSSLRVMAYIALKE